VSVRRLLIVLACLAILGTSVYFVHGYQVRRNATGLLEQARMAEDEGKVTQALDYLSQYIHLVPSDTDVLARYGQMLRKAARKPRDKMEAYFVLDRVVNRDGSRQDVRLEVIRLAIELGRFEDARVHIDQLLKLVPADAVVLGLRARCEAGAHQFHAARDYYDRAVQLDASRVDLWEEYATLLRVRFPEVRDRADLEIEKMIEANPRSAAGRLAAARYLLKSGEADKAAEHMRFALEELKADDAEALTLAATVATVRGKIEDARRHLERGLDLHPNDSRMRQDLARLENLSGHRDRAVELVQTDLKAPPDGFEELLDLGNLLIDLNEVSAAQVVIERLNKAGADWAVSLLRARLSVRQKAWGEARLRLERLRTNKFLAPVVSRQAHVLLADCYAALGNPDQQAATCRQALEIDPFWVPARLRLAEALVALRKPDEAIEQYRGMVEKVPQARFQIARLLAAKVLAQPPSRRRWDEVEKAWGQLTDQQRQSPEGKLLWAEILAGQGKAEDAWKLVEAVRDADPRRPAPWLLLAQLLRLQGKKEAILPLLVEAERRVGKRLEWELVRAQHWAAAGGDEATQRLKELAGAIATPSDADQLRLLLPLGLVYERTGDVATAMRLWRMLPEKAPADLESRLLLLEAALRTDQTQGIRELVGEIERVEGEQGPAATYGWAAVIVLEARSGNRKGLAEARRNLKQVISLRPSWTWPITLLAEVEELDGNRDQAERDYLDALERGEGRLFVIRHLLQLLYDARRYTEAAALLEKLPEQARVASGLDRISAELTFLDDRLDNPAARRKQALERARKAVSSEKPNWRDLHWLGQMAWMAGELKEAETALRQARDLADKEPATWMALIQLLALTDPDRGKAELAEAERRLPSKVAPLVLAAGYEALGQKDEAANRLQVAMHADPANPAFIAVAADFYKRTGDFARAEPLLRRLMDPATKAPSPVVAAARRSLAIGLARQRGDPSSLEEALALVDDNLKAGNAQTDRYAKVMVLATRPARRADAIRLLEEMAPLDPKTPPELLFLLAQLHVVEGNWPRAQACLLTILRSHGDDAPALGLLVVGLLRRGELDEARTYVDRLAAVAPQSPTTAELRARVLAASGKKDEAVRLLEEQAGQEKTALAQLAKVLDDIGGYDAGERLYRRHIAESKKPDAVLLLALHFGKCGKVPEGLAICEEAWKTCKAEHVAGTSVSVVMSGKGAEADVRRVEGWLAEALRQAPDSTSLAASLSDLYVYADRRAEAVKIYRDLLRRNENDVIAMNNLACVLAFEPGKGEEALALINKAIGLVGPVVDMLDTRALVLMQNDQPDQALKDAEEAAARSPTAAAHFRLAQAQLKAGKKLDAAASFQKAVKQGLKEEDLARVDRPSYRDLVRELQ
jgi:tetratricopeptide (TPR) repeat protein